MRLQLFLEARDLPNKAGIFKGISDPFAVVKLASNDEEIGRTEYIKNCLSPRWTRGIFYDFPTDVDALYIIVTIFDDNDCHTSTTDSLDINRVPSAFELMTKTMINLKPLIENAKNGVSKVFTLENGAELILRTKVSDECNEIVNLQFRCLGLKNVEKGALGLNRSDPFFEIAKLLGGHWVPVYRSEVISNHLNPLWQKLEIKMDHLCDGDEYKTLRIVIFDGQEETPYLISKTFSRSLIGMVETNLNCLIQTESKNGNADVTNAFDLQKLTSDGDVDCYTVVGKLVVLKAEREY